MTKISSYLWYWVAQVVNVLATCVHLLHYQRHCLSNCVILLDIYCSIDKLCNWELRYVVFRFNSVSAWVNLYIEGTITHKWKRFPQVCEHHTERVTLGVRHARGGAVVLGGEPWQRFCDFKDMIRIQRLFLMNLKLATPFVHHLPSSAHVINITFLLLNAYTKIG